MYNFNRLKCGCLITCDSESGAIWIEHSKCILDSSLCDIDNYYKQHKPCTICGRCIKCFEHKDCNSIKRLHIRLINLLMSLLFNLLYNIKSFIIRVSNKKNK